MRETLSYERALGRGFAALAGATLALMVVGATVRAHGAGLACPDWPLCFGEIVPVFDMRIALEWGHRAFAGSLSLGLLLLTYLTRRRPVLWRENRVALAWVWSLLGVQVLLGGATVLLRLAPWTVTAHLLTGTLLLVSLAWIAANLAGTGSAPARLAGPRASGRLLMLALALLVVQLTLGGMVSSRNAGFVCPDFPTCDGESVVPTLAGVVGLHVLHRLNGYALLAVVASLAVRLRAHASLGRWASGALLLILLQIGIGAANVLLGLPAEITALHTLTAAGVALTSTLMLREWLRARAEQAAAAPTIPHGSALEAR
jgi:heme a synthase